MGLFALLGMLLAPQLVWLAPGFAAVPEKFDLAVRLTRIMFPFLPLIALAAQAMGMLNSKGSFGVRAVGSIFFNLGAVGFGLLLGFVAGPWLGIQPVEGMAYGVVLGLVASWIAAVLPAVIGNAAVQMNVMVNTSFAAEGSIARARWPGKLARLCCHWDCLQWRSPPPCCQACPEALSRRTLQNSARLFPARLAWFFC